MTADLPDDLNVMSRPVTYLTWEANYKNSMTYIEQFETELRKKYDEAQDEKVLESYRNGITAGQKGTRVIRKGQSRRRGFPSQIPMPC